MSAIIFDLHPFRSFKYVSEIILNNLIKSLLIIAPLFWIDMSHAQSLKEQLEVQKKYDLLEEMRKKDEKEITEFEKSKNSIPRNKLSEAGIYISCERPQFKDRRYPSAAEMAALGNIQSFFSDSVMADSNLYSVRRCSKRNREERFCASKIAKVAISNADIEYSLKNNPDRKDSDFDYGNIKDWYFDGSSSTLIVKYGRNSTSLFEMSCTKKRWLDD
jgi:hypothetical protein